MPLPHLIQRIALISLFFLAPIGAVSADQPDKTWANKKPPVSQPQDKRAIPQTSRRAFIGRVTGPTSQPVSDITIEWSSPSGQGKVERTQTDRDGRFQLPVEQVNPDLWLVVYGKGWAPEWKMDIVPGLPPNPTQVDIKLSPGHWITGILVSSQGDPIEGVLVQPTRPHEGFYSSFSSPTGGEALPGPEVKTDASGYFRFDDVPAKIGLRFNHATYHLNDGNYAVDQDHLIEMHQPDRVIRGRVLDDTTGKPISAFTVERVKQQPVEFSAEDGRFLITGLWNYCFNETLVRSSGYRPLKQEITAKSQSESEEVIFRLTTGEPLRAKVLDARHEKPLSGVPVVYAVLKQSGAFCWGEVQQRGMGDDRFRDEYRTITAEDGTCSFPIESEEQGTIFILMRGFERHIVWVRERQSLMQDGQLQIRLKPEESISGVLIRDGEPLANEDVSVRRERANLNTDENFEKTRTDAQGQFKIGSLTPGTYHLTAIGFTQRVTVKEGEAAKIELGGNLGNIVLVGQGQPWTHISLRPQFEWHYTGYNADADADGRFRIAGLRPGPYTAFIHKHYRGSGMFMHKTLTIVVEQDGEVDLKTGEVRVR